MQGPPKLLTPAKVSVASPVLPSPKENKRLIISFYSLSLSFEGSNTNGNKKNCLDNYTLTEQYVKSKRYLRKYSRPTQAR